MKKVYLAPMIYDQSVYLINGVADISTGSGQGDSGSPNPSPNDGYETLSKERYDVDKIEYGNLW